MPTNRNIKPSATKNRVPPILQINAPTTSPYSQSPKKNIGIPISKLGVPDQTLIAMVNRHGEALFPDDDFVLAEEDHVLVFTLKGKLPEVENFFF